VLAPCAIKRQLSRVLFCEQQLRIRNCIDLLVEVVVEKQRALVKQYWPIAYLLTVKIYGERS